MGPTATNENAMLYNAALETVTTGNDINLPTNQINSTGSITASGTNGLSLTAGQYLVNFVSDAGVTAAGDIGVGLAIDGAPLTHTQVSLTRAEADTERIATSAIINVTGTQVLTVRNTTANSDTYENSVLSVVKLS